MNRFLVFLTLLPFGCCASSICHASSTNTVATQHKQVIPLEPGIPLVAENLKTYLIPCHREIGTTIYVEDNIIDISGPFFWLETGGYELDPAIHHWVVSFTNSGGANYINVMPNPELDPSILPSRRNLNIICKGKVFSIEPYVVSNEAQAARMVYFRATDGRLRVEAPKAVEQSAPSQNKGAEVNGSVNKQTDSRLNKVSPVTPQIRNHGITPNVLISYLQKFKLLTGLPGMEMPDVEVYDEHFPAADFKGIKSGILSVYRDKGAEVMGFNCYLKNNSQDRVSVNTSNLSIRIGEKVFLCKLTDPNKIDLMPGEDAKFISVFQDRDFATLKLKGNKYTLITDLNVTPVAGSVETISEPLTMVVECSNELEGVLAKVIRAQKSKTSSAIIAIRNVSSNAVDCNDYKFEASRSGKSVQSFQVEPADGWIIKPNETKGFAVFFSDESLSSGSWESGVKVKVTKK